MGPRWRRLSASRSPSSSVIPVRLARAWWIAPVCGRRARWPEPVADRGDAYIFLGSAFQQKCLLHCVCGVVGSGSSSVLMFRKAGSLEQRSHRLRPRERGGYPRTPHAHARLNTASRRANLRGGCDSHLESGDPEPPKQRAHTRASAFTLFSSNAPCLRCFRWQLA